MKTGIVTALLLLFAVSSLSLAGEFEKDEKDDAFTIKAGYFDSSEEERKAGAWDLDIDGAAAFGAEYYSITRNDIAVSVSVFYSRPDLEGVLWDGANWVAVNEDIDYWQLGFNYIRFAEPVNRNLHSYEGGYYGLGVGYSRMNVDNVKVGGVTYDLGDIHQNSLDLNLIGGFKWYSGFGVEGKWIADEEAYTVMGAYWF